MGIGITEWVIILLVVLLVFGAGRLPQLGRALGEGVRNLKKGLSESGDDSDETRPRRDGPDRGDPPPRGGPENPS